MPSSKKYTIIAVLVVTASLSGCGNKYRIYPDIWKQKNERAVQFFVMGEKYEDRNDIANAIYSYSQAIRLDPNYGEAFFARGSLYTVNGDRKKALEDISRAVELQPHNGWLFITRGILYYEEGLFLKALPDLRTSTELIPVARVTSYYYLGACFAMLKKPKRAVSYLQKAIGEGYDNVSELKNGAAFRHIRETEEYKTFIRRIENALDKKQ